MEVEKLEQRAEILLSQIEKNAKKIRNSVQNNGQWDLRRISANARMINELEWIAATINQIWENSERDLVAHN
jgi:vacuolar-type H+-ATPase subunit H